MAWDDGINENSSAYKIAKSESNCIRVVAGPGTGKSYGLRKRVARLIEEGQDPSKILAVTFTRAAAADLKKEIIEGCGTDAEKVVTKTLHSFCLGILIDESVIAHTHRMPRTLSDFEINPLLFDLNEKYGNIKEKMKRLQAFQASWARMQQDDPGYPKAPLDEEFQKDIKKWLREHNAMLIDEIIPETFNYLKNNPYCPEREKFDYILVDEYQDLNKVEQEVIDYLSEQSKLIIIGDDDQSIYSFKYAHPDGIRSFPENHQGCENIELDKCRRCPPNVVKIASALISNNDNRTLGYLEPYEKNQNGFIENLRWNTLDNEIQGIAITIADDLGKGDIKPKDCLVLVPRKKIGLKLKGVLNELGVKSETFFSESLTQSTYSKYFIELLCLVVNPDDMVALRFLLGFGNRSYRSTSYKRLLAYAQSTDLNVHEVLDEAIDNELSVSGINSLVKQYKSVISDLELLKSTVQQGRKKIIDYYISMTDSNDSLIPILQQAVDNRTDDEPIDIWWKSLYKELKENILEYNNRDNNCVKIMSLHGSKGLSSRYVVIMNVIDGLLPDIKTDSDLSEEKQIEEQRRLFYVALTRVKGSENGYPGKLIISACNKMKWEDAKQNGIKCYRNGNRFVTVKASPFLNELGNELPGLVVK